MIQDIINELKSKKHYNSGEHIEIAKGKHELVYSLKDAVKKIKRSWHLKK